MEFKASEVYSLVHCSTRMLGYFRIMAGFKVKINDVNEDSVSLLSVRERSSGQ